jgi:hypothetical protein
MSTLFGGAQKTTTKSEPWKPQGQALQFAFDQAQNIFNSKAGTPWYQGPLHAGLDPLTSQGIGGIGDYATGAGADAAAQVGGTASDILGGSAGGFLPSIGNFAAAASADPTMANIQAAGLYADNPYLNAQIDAIGHDIGRTLNEGTLPAIDRAAVGTGNINSSRTGVAEGIAERGAQEELADAAAGIRSNAYQSGLGLAEGAREAQLGALGQIPGMYGSGIGLGYTGALQGQGMTLADLNAMIAGGQINQNDQQGQYDSDLMRWLGNDSRDSDLLKQYFGIVGSNNFGGTTTSKTTGGGPGIIGGLLGGAAAIGGLVGTGGAFPGAFGLFNPGG